MYSSTNKNEKVANFVKKIHFICYLNKDPHSSISKNTIYVVILRKIC